MNAAMLNWDSLFFRGSIVDLDINIWSARLSVRPADLGIVDTPDVREALGLGVVRLAPHKAFEKLLAIRRAALKDVENASFNFPFIRGARYVPEKKVEYLLSCLADRKYQFESEVSRFAENYEQTRYAMIPVIRKALVDASCDNVEASIARIVAEYPEDVTSCFGFEWKVYSISGAKSQAAADAVAKETESVKDVVREIVVQLRDEFSEKVKAIAAIIARGAKIPSTSLESARELLNRVKEMNVFGDVELNNQVRAFERVLALASTESVPTNAFTTFGTDLNQIQDVLTKSLDEAVAAAEKNLTGLGNRRIQFPEEVA